MSTGKIPPPPKGCRRSGRKLWKAVTSALELDAHEELLLLQAVRVVDRLDEMAETLENAPLTVRNAKGDELPHPLLVESRQQALTLARLVASLRLPSGLIDGAIDVGGPDELARPQRRGAARGPYGVRRVV